MKFCENCGIRMDAISIQISELEDPYTMQPHHAQGCPARWHSEYTPVVHIRLDDYEAINLLWLLRKAYTDIPEIMTGDWNGTVMYQLEEAIHMMGGTFLTHTPNNDWEDWEL